MGRTAVFVRISCGKQIGIIVADDKSNDMLRLQQTITKLHNTNADGGMLLNPFVTDLEVELRANLAGKMLYFISRLPYD